MTARSPSAFALSALLHAGMAALALLGIYYSQQRVTVRPVVFELVAGEGNNYGATEAPALGSPSGRVKFSVPETKPIPQPAKPAPQTIEPARVETMPPKPAPAKVADFNKLVKRIDDRKIKKALAQLQAERAAEQKRISKEEYDRLHKKSASAKTASTAPHAAKVPRIDTQGISTGVFNGSTANKTGGAGGKALTREKQSEIDSYTAFVQQQLKAAFDAVKPAGLSDQLEADVELHILANGTLVHARIVKSSGSDEFDHAALVAVMQVGPLGARPEGLSEVQTIPFRMSEPDSTN